MVATGFAAAGRGLQRSLLGHHLPTPAAKQPPEGAGWIRRFLTPLADPQSWLNSLWVMINFLMSLVTFPLAVAWTVGAIATVGGPVATLILRRALPPATTTGSVSCWGSPGPRGRSSTTAPRSRSGWCSC